jgi:hypothetical protein
MTNKKRKIIVIGGGAAGLMAAGAAAELGAEVLLLEKMKRPGRKLCITGKGRCNITNIAEISDFLAHFGGNGKFLRQAFHHFFNQDLLLFFQKLGLEVVTERGRRVFPKSGKAQDVLEVLLEWLRVRGVKIEAASPAASLQISEGRVIGVVSADRILPCQAVILATGGASYPATGSSGDGYRIAAEAGHAIIAIRPALVPLKTTGSEAHRMAGLNLRNIKASLYIDGKKKKEEFGELVFADFGVTGPVILSLSGLAVDALNNNQKVEIAVDLKPALDENKLEARISRDLASRAGETVDSLLRGLLPKEMVPVCLDSLKISPQRLSSSIGKPERIRLRRWLKEFRLRISGFRPFAEAIITAGGVDTKEIDPRTMQSRKTKGLYLAGELLDIQADTGGYNLQAAFSTGRLAGVSAATASA